MGNNLSPVIAIIFMASIEFQIQQRLNIRLWVRYIDDIFYVSREDKDEVLRVANSIHQSIQFTQESPKDNTMPYLDTEVKLEDDGKFSYRMHIKPIHSGHTVPFKSHIPHFQKFSVMVNEFKRAVRCSSNRETGIIPWV